MMMASYYQPLQAQLPRYLAEQAAAPLSLADWHGAASQAIAMCSMPCLVRIMRLSMCRSGRCWCCVMAQVQVLPHVLRWGPAP